MSKGLTRQEMQRDEIREALGRSFDYATSHTALLKRIALGSGIAIVLAIAIGWYLSNRSQQSGAELAKAIRAFGAEVVATGSNPNDPTNPTFPDAAARRARAKELFSKVNASYGGTDAGRVSRVFLGRIAAEEGDLEGARKLWQQFVDGAPGHLLAPEVKLALLQLDVAAGKAEEVASKLDAMVTGSSPELPRDLVLFELGKLREKLGQTVEAAAAYQRIVEEFPRSSYLLDAQRKAAALSNG